MLPPVEATSLVKGVRSLGIREEQLSKRDLDEIATIIRETSGRKYIKKSLKSSRFSLICTEKATYILCKTHLGHKRSLGGEKRGTTAIQISRDQAKVPTLVYQLVNHDHLENDTREALIKEFELQANYAKRGIAPEVFDTFAYSKTRKNGTVVEKQTAFVEAFDFDLYAFDPLATEKQCFTLSPQQVFDVGLQLASYLEALHADDCAHRDISAENIGVWCEEKTVTKLCLTDLNTLATADCEPLAVYGHLEYSAPEYFLKTVKDERAADMYALGILLYILTELESEDIEDWEPAWMHDLVSLNKKVKDAMVPPEEYLDFILRSEELETVLEGQMQYKPTIRPEQAGDVHSFNKAVISWCVHPDPAQRLTARSLVELCRAFKK